MSAEFNIGKKLVGLNHPTFFVADIAANHDGDIERAKNLIHLCAESGVDAAKFQNFTAKSLVSSIGFNNLGEQKTHQANWEKSVFEVYDDASIPLEWTKTLKETCDTVGIEYFTSPYDLELIDYLLPHVCAWKLGSGDITCHEEIERLSSDNIPLLIATGASDIDEVRAAINIATKNTSQIVLMQCNTNYSGSTNNFKYISLNVLKTYSKLFPDVVLGLSDHTPGHVTVLGSVALGARVIEKHFTDDTSRSGSDHPFSMDPDSWREMVDRTRELENSLGVEDKYVMDNEKETIIVQRRSICAKHDISKDQILTKNDLTYLRPCPLNTLPPHRYNELLGKKILRDVKSGEHILISDVE